MVAGVEDLPKRNAAVKHSPMQRATLRGLKRNAALVLGNIGATEDYAAGTCSMIVCFSCRMRSSSRV